MNKKVIRNNLILILSIVFIILTGFGYSIENSMMFVICGFISILLVLRFLIIVFIYIRNNKKRINEITKIRNSQNQTPFEKLYLSVLDNNLNSNFSSDLNFKVLNSNEIEVNTIYNGLTLKFIIDPNYITFNGEKQILLSLTFSDLASQINKKINYEKSKIDDLKNNSDLYTKEVTKSRLENLRGFIKFVKSGIIVSLLTCLIFIALLITFIFNKDFRNTENLVEIITVISCFSLLIIIFICYIFYSLPFVFLNSKIIKDEKNNNISNLSTKVKNVKLCLTQKKNKNTYVKCLVLKTDDGKFIVPVAENTVLVKLANKKQICEKIKNVDNSFSYYTSSRVVITNNEIYEEIIRSSF